MNRQDTLNALIRVYKSSLKGTKIGIFLGAGVSKESKIPDFRKFAFQAFEAAYEEDPGFSGNVSIKLKDYIGKQATLEESDLEPEEIFLLIRDNFMSKLGLSEIEWKQNWLHFCAKQLYKSNTVLEANKWRIQKEVYGKNITLKSIISFCLAHSDDFSDQSLISYLESSKFLKSSKTTRNIGWNARIGSVLTTNYDNLFEYSSGTT